MLLAGPTHSHVPTHVEYLLVLPLYGIEPVLQLGDGPAPLCYCLLAGSLLGLLPLPEPDGCGVWE